MAAPKKVDWERIEPGWRAGIKSVQQLADEYTEDTGVAVTRGAINKHFKGLGVPRDLRAKIQAKAESMVSAALVSGKVSIETTVSDAQIINDNAGQVASVLLGQRKDIQRYRNLCQSLLAQLEAETGEHELFAQIGELLAAPDDKGMDKLNEAYHKAISLPSRIDGVKKLSETLKTLIGLERQAFGIEDRGIDKPDDEQEAGSRDLIESARAIAFTLARAAKMTRNKSG